MAYSGDRLEDDIAALAVCLPAHAPSVPPPSPAG